jgi:murein DD-endopeptidase MepM/ murein hydrolase activator NlpD
MNKQPYFVVVLAHSLHGRLQRVYIPHQTLYAAILLAVLGCFSVFGLSTTYMRMSRKVAHFDSLRGEMDLLRARYQALQKVTNQESAQLATLESFASEVSVAFGLQRELDLPLGETYSNGPRRLCEYNFLQSASLSRLYRNYPRQWQANVRPSVWPVNGRLVNAFGLRTNPFSGEGAIHSGIDLAAPAGTMVRAAADGIVVFAEWSKAQGQMVRIDHGNGLQTSYGSLSGIDVVAGQEIRRGDVIGRSGVGGHSVEAHVHYEVRMGGTPVNPYPYLAASTRPGSGRSF